MRRIFSYGFMVIPTVLYLWIGSWLIHPWFISPTHTVNTETAYLTGNNGYDIQMVSYKNGKAKVIVDDTTDTGVYLTPNKIYNIQNNPINAVADTGTVEITSVTPHSVTAKVNIVQWSNLNNSKFFHVFLSIFFLIVGAMGLLAYLSEVIFPIEEELSKEKKERKLNPYHMDDFFREAWIYVQQFASPEELKNYQEKILSLWNSYQQLDTDDKLRYERNARTVLQKITSDIKNEASSRFQTVTEMITETN